MGSVALCEELCDEKRFRKFVGGPIIEIRRAVGISLFDAFDNDATWGVHHRIIRPMLTADSVRTLFIDIRNTTTELTSKWKAMSATSEAKIKPIEELNRLDTETTTLCFHGRRLNNLTGPPAPMIQSMDGITSECIKRPTRPGFLNWLLYQGKFDRDIKTFRDYCADSVAYRKAHPTDRKDMLYTMMNAKDPDTGKSLNDTQVIDELGNMSIGTSTAPCALSTAIYYLVKNPECIVKARQELDSVIGKEEFTHAHLDKLPYTTGIMRETLRLCGPAPGFNIEPIPGINQGKPVSLAQGKYEIAEKQYMIVVLHGVNRDPTVFGPDPEAFRPERMMGEAWEKLPEGAKKWFGNGKRVCIGQDYAWMWNMTVLVTLIRDVDFAEVDATYTLKQDGWFNLRPVGFEVTVKARSS